MAPPRRPYLYVGVTGTRSDSVSNGRTCEAWSEPWSGLLPNYEMFLGRPVLQNGVVTAVDFNRTLTVSGVVITTTGRLEVQ